LFWVILIARDSHKRTNTIKNTTKSSWEKFMNSSWCPQKTHNFVYRRRRFQPFKLEGKLGMMEKFWKNIKIQCPKIL
jgi:hypothetical protein